MEKLIKLSREYRNAEIETWLHESLFTFNWWLLLFTTLTFIIIWVIILNKKRMIEIIVFGLMVELIALGADVIGDFLVLWKYRYLLLPFPTILEIHTAQMPIFYMIIYQYFTKWKTFLIAITIMALIFAFILEPLTAWLDIYRLYHWKYWYSFLPYIIIGVVLKFIIGKLKKKQNSYLND